MLQDKMEKIVRKYLTRKRETKYEKYWQIPEYIEVDKIDECSMCGDDTPFVNVQTNTRIHMCCEQCNEEWWWEHYQNSLREAMKLCE